MVYGCFRGFCRSAVFLSERFSDVGPLQRTCCGSRLFLPQVYFLKTSQALSAECLLCRSFLRSACFRGAYPSLFFCREPDADSGMASESLPGFGLQRAGVDIECHYTVLFHLSATHCFGFGRPKKVLFHHRSSFSVISVDNSVAFRSI